MTHVKPTKRREEKPAWFSRPGQDHLVQLYDHEQVLVTCLQEYVATGLERNETCIVIATPHILISLQKALRMSGINLARALSNAQYVTYDAEEIVMNFMDGRLLNVDKFRVLAERIIELHQRGGRPIRVYGETVAVLLAQHNLQAAMLLERQWTQVMMSHDCSLYCACSEASLHEVQGHVEVEEGLASRHTLFMRECQV